MNPKHIEILEVMIYELGHNVIEVDGRYYVGTIELPDATQSHCTLIGKEVTHFFSLNSITKTKESLISELNAFTTQYRSINIKFNVNTPWYSYSR